MGDECRGRGLGLGPPLGAGHTARMCHMWLLLTTLLGALGVGLCGAICPPRCRCNDDALQVSCVGANLQVVPIQLNPEVRYIDIASNKIANVVFTFSFYNHLLALNLSTNKIQTLGSGNFLSQRHLRHLNLSSNELESLSKDSLKGLRAVSELDLSYNQIDRISVLAFRDLHSLEILRLTGNRLVSLEEGTFKPAFMLRELLLDDNQLVEMPGRALGDSLNLLRLSLSDNLLVSVNEADMADLASLQVLHLDNNVISDIEAGALSGLSALEHLDLGDNNLTAIPTVSLSKLSNLTRLRLSGNLVHAVPPVAFRGIFQLRFLYLTHLDYLTFIDARAFVDNINLERIWLDENLALETLPTRLFYGNPRLSHVSIRNNRLSSLEASHFPLDQLSALDVAGNPLVCNCTLMWLWRLGDEQRVAQAHAPANDSRRPADAQLLRIDIERIECADPEPLRAKLLADVGESAMGCSITWLTACMIVTCVSLCVMGAVSLALCGGRPRQKAPATSIMPPIEHRHYTHHHHQHNGRSASLSNGNGGPGRLEYEDKYMMGANEYQALSSLAPPPWEPYSDSKDYVPEYEVATKTISIPNTRPHIVYV